MVRNCLAAALRHLARNKFYTVISVVGLSIGLCTALLAALVVRNQLGQDHFIPGHERVYLAMTAITPPGHATVYLPSTGSFVGKQLALKFSEIEATTRLVPETAVLHRANIQAKELIYHADPNAFDVLTLPSLAGNLKTALARPDAIVLSRNAARKYFGRDAPLGETLLVDGSHLVTVTAVIEDLPANDTHLQSGIFISGLAPWSELRRQDTLADNVPGSYGVVGIPVYLKLALHASPQRLLKDMPAMTRLLFAPPPQGTALGLTFVRLDRLNAFPGLHPGFSSRLLMVAITGAGVLIIAGVNFVNLLTARCARRAREVSIRKLAGAHRWVLVQQFLTESLAYVFAASLVAVALTELLLPHVNAFLTSGATFRYWQEPALIVSIAGVVLLLGMMVGAYPALVLSAFSPLRVLSGETRHSRGAEILRLILVTSQFAILIGLIIAAAVVYEQRRFATQDALRVNVDQMLLIRSPCNEAFTSQLLSLAGVRGLACSSSSFIDHPVFNIAFINDRAGIEHLLRPVDVQPGFLDLYGIKPVAGRLSGSPGSSYLLLNQTAALQLGFSNPSDAIGFQYAAYGRGNGPKLPVVGVVPDFAVDSVEHKIEAQEFVVAAKNPYFDLITVKLTGHQIPETLMAIDRLWKATGAPDPINRVFLEQHIQTLYAAMLREAQLFGVFAAVAVILACLGLLGLAASIADRRDHEIGIRKALGADTGNILRLLLRQFAWPVLWANLIAWPVTAYAMHRWLQSFAYRVDLELWLFPAAAALALAIALLTVTIQSVQVAGASPVDALRYE